MKIIDNFRILAIYILLISSENSIASSSDLVIFTESSSYRDRDSRAVLSIRENSFINKPTCDFTEDKWPPYNMSQAIKYALEWANKNHSDNSWRINSVNLKFYTKIAGSCVYILKLKSESTQSKRISYISIGVDMTGELIKPTIEKKDLFERRTW